MAQGYNICCISLNMTDRIRLIGLSSDVVDSMRIAITNSWGEIQSERDYYGTFEFKLRGHPWWGQGDDVVYSRRLLAAILKTMAKLGWNLVQAADVSKKPDDKDTLFFETGTADPKVELFAISFNSFNLIRIIDAPSFETCVKYCFAFTL